MVRFSILFVACSQKVREGKQKGWADGNIASFALQSVFPCLLLFASSISWRHSCPNCSTAPANCCCAPPKKPATLTRFAATKTVTVVVTKTTLKALVPQRRSLTDDVADAAIAAAGSDTSESLGITMEHSIKERSVPRNLCPVCPKGAAVSGKNNGNAKPVYCCPARKTVTKTLKKTLTIKKTKTKTVTGVKVGCFRFRGTFAVEQT